MTLSTKSVVASALLGALAILPVAAFAQTNSNAGTSDMQCRSSNGITTLNAATTAEIIAAGDCSIALRNTYLEAAQTRVNQLQRVSSSTQESLVTTLQSTESTLATIKTSLDADTSTSTAIASYSSIFNSVRVFALVLPRTWVYAASDREMTISTALQTVDTELVSKNASASSTAQTADAPLLADILVQLSTINSDSASAETTVQPLMPDNGSTTTRTSNASAIRSAQSMVKSAQASITTILNDIKEIRTNLGV